MKILFVGDIMGGGGRRLFQQYAMEAKRAGEVDYIVVNGENSAGGKGITSKIAKEFFEAGADVITLGDHSFDQREVIPYLDEEPRIVRPVNFAEGCPGHGVYTINLSGGLKFSVVNLIGRVFMNPMACPFRAMDALLESGQAPGPVILVDFHAEATSEKVAMGRYLDGRVSAVFGTHTHVQTADDRILPKGTAYLSDAGMTGPKESVIGCQIGPVLSRFLTGMPVRFEPASEDFSLEGVCIEVEPLTGKAKSIKRLQYRDGDRLDPLG